MNKFLDALAITIVVLLAMAFLGLVIWGYITSEPIRTMVIIIILVGVILWALMRCIDYRSKQYMGDNLIKRSK